MVWEEREVQSRIDYILGTDCCLFRNVAVRYPRHNSYHYLILGCLRSAPLRERTKSLGQCMRLFLCPPTTPTREDRLFADIQRSIPKPKARESRKNTWILVETWRPVDKKISAHQDSAKD